MCFQFRRFITNEKRKTKNEKHKSHSEYCVSRPMYTWTYSSLFPVLYLKIFILVSRHIPERIRPYFPSYTWKYSSSFPVMYLNIFVLVSEVLGDELHCLSGLVCLRGEEDVAGVAVASLSQRWVLLEGLAGVELAGGSVQVTQLHHLRMGQTV